MIKEIFCLKSMNNDWTRIKYSTFVLFLLSIYMWIYLFSLFMEIKYSFLPDLWNIYLVFFLPAIISFFKPNIKFYKRLICFIFFSILSYIILAYLAKWNAWRILLLPLNWVFLFIIVTIIYYLYKFYDKKVTNNNTYVYYYKIFLNIFIIELILIIILWAFIVNKRNETINQRKVISKLYDNWLCDEIIKYNNSFKDVSKCYLDFAIKNNNLDFCEKIQNNIPKDKCYYHFAVKNNNLDLCEKIQDKSNKDNCYYNLAIKNNSLDLCEKIKDDYILRE